MLSMLSHIHILQLARARQVARFWLKMGSLLRLLPRFKFDILWPVLFGFIAWKVKSCWVTLPVLVGTRYILFILFQYDWTPCKCQCFRAVEKSRLDTVHTASKFSLCSGDDWINMTIQCKKHYRIPCLDPEDYIIQHNFGRTFFLC